MKQTDYTYLVFMYGKHYVDNVLRHCEGQTENVVPSPERYLESMNQIVEFYNKNNATNLRVELMPSVEHIVYEDEEGGYYHQEKEK